MGPEAPRPLVEYVENRAERLGSLRLALSTVLGVTVSTEGTKALFIQLGFSGSVDSWCSKYYPEQIEKLTLAGTPAAWIYEFQDAMTFVLKHVARAHPDALRDAGGSESTVPFPCLRQHGARDPLEDDRCAGKDGTPV